jgi:hypothetical protein
MNPAPYSAASEADLQAAAQQLGRAVRGVIGVAARCACGAPAVLVTRPRLDDGSPFPTLYYLSLPSAVAAMSTLEAGGAMARFTALLADDPELRSRYAQAHERYLADRDRVEAVPEIAGVSAGGMPRRVKCLHALAAHALAAGPGVNPIGDLALAATDWSITLCRCGPRDATLAEPR